MPTLPESAGASWQPMAGPAGVSQLVPVKPLVQVQVWELPLDEQVPPFWHGLGEHGSTHVPFTQLPVQQSSVPSHGAAVGRQPWPLQVGSYSEEAGLRLVM